MSAARAERETARRRKLSFPAQFHHNLLGLPGPPSRPFKRDKRRFSNVGDAVSRKLSSTIGWRTNSVPTAEIVAQGKTLCGQYIRCRLKRSNVFNKKCGLQRLRSVVGISSGGTVVREVFPELWTIGQELERLHPALYTGVARQVSSTPVLASDKAVASVLTGVARELARDSALLTWARVVSLYAVAGGLAADCVRQGHPEYIHAIIDSMGQAIDFHLADWIAHHGGWTGLLTYCKPADNDISLAGFISALAAALAVFLLIFMLLRWLGRQAIFSYS